MQLVSYYLLLKTTRRHLYTFILQDFLREACHQIPIVYPPVGDRSPCRGIPGTAPVMSVAGGGGVFNHQSNVVRLSPCMAVRLAPSLPLNCSETGLFRDGFASLICFAETGEKRER